MQQLRIGVWQDQADNQDSEHIEQQNTPENLPHSARNIFRRIFRFARRDTDQLGALEGESHNHRHPNHGRKAARKRRVAHLPVLPARMLSTAHNAGDHQHANDDKDNHGGHFNQREPVFRLAKAFDRNVVEQEHQPQEQRAPDPARRVGEPVVHHQLRRDQVNRDGHRPVVPVVPAECETKALFDIFCAVGGEGTRYRHERSQFAEAGHQEVDHQAYEDIGEQCSAGASLSDGGTGGDKQAGTNGAADGDHRQVTGF